MNFAMLPMWVVSGVFFSSSHFPVADAAVHPRAAADRAERRAAGRDAGRRVARGDRRRSGDPGGVEPGLFRDRAEESSAGSSLARFAVRRSSFSELPGSSAACQARRRGGGSPSSHISAAGTSNTRSSSTVHDEPRRVAQLGVELPRAPARVAHQQARARLLFLLEQLPQQARRTPRCRCRGRSAPPRRPSGRRRAAGSRARAPPVRPPTARGRCPPTRADRA